MKIVSLTSLFPNNRQPDNCVFIRERVAYLSKLHDLRVVAPVPYFPRIKLHGRWYEHSLVTSHERIAGLEVYHPRYLITPGVGMALYGLTYFISILNFMRKLNRTDAYDIIDGHYIYPDGLAAVLVARALRKPVILSARGTDINLFTTYPLIRRWIVYALRRCDHVIAVSEALKRRIVEIGIAPGKIAVIPNGVDTAQFRPLPKDEARRTLDLPPGATVLLSVGSLRSLKGFHHLISALNKLRDSHDELDLRLYIVGDGQERENLQRQIDRLALGSFVNLMGRIPHEELQAWYNAADLFCLVSSREGWPNVIMESLACGLPVLATRVGGIPEILHSEKLGLLLDAVDGPELEKQLVESIPAALGKTWDREELVGSIRERSWEGVARKVSDVLQRALDGRGERDQLEARRTGSA
jgi:glycosyltransferase involved in cell wall biosynthesis